MPVETLVKPKTGGDDMVRNHDPFDRVYSAFRKRVADGSLSPGAAIVIQAEARALGVSITPVREALARLSGEGIVERGPHGGYVAAPLNPGLIEDRYLLRGELVQAAVRRLERLDLKGVLDQAPSTDRLFSWLVASSGGEALHRAFVRVDLHLHPLAHAEARLFEDNQDRARMASLAREERLYDLRYAVEQHHDRRAKAAATITALACRP